MEVLFCDCVQRGELVDSGVIDQNVDPPEGLVSFAKQMFDVLFFGNIALYCNCFPAVTGDLIDDAVGTLLGHTFTSAVSIHDRFESQELADQFGH